MFSFSGYVLTRIPMPSSRTYYHAHMHTHAYTHTPSHTSHILATRSSWTLLLKNVRLTHFTTKNSQCIVYVCMCADMVYVYICMCVCICASMRLYTCICVCVCILVYRLWVLVSVFQRVDGVMHAHEFLCAYACVYVCV